MSEPESSNPTDREPSPDATVRLSIGQAHRFVSLGVRPQSEPVLARVVRHPSQIALEDIQIHHQRRRVNVRNVHISYGK